MATRRQLEDELVDVSHQLHAGGWVANHDGNITVRIGTGRYLATPTAVSKADVTRASLIVVDDRGAVVSGTRKPFSELALHLAVYRARRDVEAVIHAHPPTATGLSVAGIQVRTTMLAESVVSLGAAIPLVPYAAPKTPDWTANLIPAVADADAVMLEHHGVITCGPDLETAYLRMELVEHLAKIHLAAHQAGLVRDIPRSDVNQLLQARTTAGLGKTARQGATAPQRADLPASNVESIIVEEISKALRR